MAVEEEREGSSKKSSKENILASTQNAGLILDAKNTRINVHLQGKELAVKFLPVKSERRSKRRSKMWTEESNLQDQIIYNK